MKDRIKELLNTLEQELTNGLNNLPEYQGTLDSLDLEISEGRTFINGSMNFKRIKKRIRKGEKLAVKRYWVNMTMEIFVPEQGCGEKLPKMRIEIPDGLQILSKLKHKNTSKMSSNSERDYHLNEVQVNYLED